jgi:hypothetical protein
VRRSSQRQWQSACVTRFSLSYKQGMLVLSLTWFGTLCWGVCFWWMHRISSRQDAMLKELHDVTQRIEQISKAEHDLIQEVHPKVSEIKDRIDTVAEQVSDGREN